MVTLEQFSSIIYNYDVMYVYDSDYNGPDGELDEDAEILFTIKSTVKCSVYLQEKYAQAEVVMADIFDGGIVRVRIQVAD